MSSCPKQSKPVQKRKFASVSSTSQALDETVKLKKRKTKTKENDIPDGMQKELFTVKRGLHSQCIEEEVYRRIQDDVQEMSKLLVEFSIYTHYILNKKWANNDFTKVRFLDHFYVLSAVRNANMSTKTETMDSEYMRLRVDNINGLHNRSGKSNSIVFAAKQYETSFNNNIWMHAYVRVKRFLKNFTENKTVVYRTLDFLFNRNSKNDTNPHLIRMMELSLGYDGERFLDVKSKPHKYLKFFYRLQCYNNALGRRNFALVPIYKHGLHHIRYDTQGLHYLLSSLRKTGGIKIKDFKTEHWKKYFKLPETGNRKFNGSISTDGVAISFTMYRYIAETSQVNDKNNDNSHVNSIRERLRKQNLPNENLHYEMYIGLDPGYKLIYGGTERGTVEMMDSKKSIKIKSSKFRSMSGAISRKYTLDKITGAVEELSKSVISPMQRDYTEYTRHRLRWFEQKQNVYGQRKVARLKLQKFICVEKTAHTIAKSIVQDRKALVFIGSTKFSPNAPIKGYIRTPHRALLKAMKIHADVVETDEFRSTKLCSQKDCHNVVKTSRSPKRYQFCPKCGTSWNRDVNAGNNIAYLGLQHLLEKEVHKNFQRGTKLHKPRRRRNPILR